MLTLPQYPVHFQRCTLHIILRGTISLRLFARDFSAVQYMYIVMICNAGLVTVPIKAPRCYRSIDVWKTGGDARVKLIWREH